MCMGLLQNLCTSLGFTSRRRWVRASPFIWWGTPHWGVWSCVATIISVAPPHRDVDGLCLATIIAMVLTSPPPFRRAPPRLGCRRPMPRHHHFDGQHLGRMPTGYTLRRMGVPLGLNMPALGPNDRTADIWCGDRRWAHRIEIRSPLLFGVGAKVSTYRVQMCTPALFPGGQTHVLQTGYFSKISENAASKSLTITRL